ncbi:MAG TPA: phosphatase PAP2 family protein [Longimicrobium sp.]
MSKSTAQRRPRRERRASPRTPDTRGQRWLFGFLRWIAGHVSGFYAAIGVFLIAAVVVILIAVFGFAELAMNVAEGETQAFDDSVLLWLDRHASPMLTGIALDVTALGAGTVVWTVVVIASFFLWHTRHRFSAVLLWVAMVGSALISSSLKAFFDRPRPDLFPWRAPYAGESSFPSGHSMTAMVAYFTLAYLIARLEPTRALKRFTFFVATVIILGVGLSRMYLGVHYPTDVIGGFFTGLAWASFCALSMEALRYFATRKPDVERKVEQDLEATADPIGGGKK